MTLHIWIPCYDDLDQLCGALESILGYGDDVTVYVVDGRYATFEGETDVTVGAENLVDQFDFATYHTPPELPIGDPDLPGYMRSPQHEQAKWVNYDLLPQDEWVMEMDTDERLKRLELDCVDDLDPEGKYTPEVITETGEKLEPAIRLYQPQYWTFWIDDVMFWRDFYPRDTPVEELVVQHAKSKHRNIRYGGPVDCIRLRNQGQQRPDEYQERRADQLETMDAAAAAAAIRDGKYPSTVDLGDYR